MKSLSKILSTYPPRSACSRDESRPWCDTPPVVSWQPCVQAHRMEIQPGWAPQAIAIVEFPFSIFPVFLGSIGVLSGRQGVLWSWCDVWFGVALASWNFPHQTGMGKGQTTPAMTMPVSPGGSLLLEWLRNWLVSPLEELCFPPPVCSRGAQVCAGMCPAKDRKAQENPCQV